MIGIATEDVSGLLPRFVMNSSLLSKENIAVEDEEDNKDLTIEFRR